MITEKKYDRDELQLKLIAEYGGYDVENPYWSFKTFAVAIEQAGKMSDVLTGDSYIDASTSMFPIEVGTIRAFPPIYQGATYTIDFKKKMNSIYDIKKAMKQSGLHFDQDLSYDTKVGAFIKSLKR